MEHDRTHFFIWSGIYMMQMMNLSRDFFVKKNLKNVIKKEMVKSI